jgi:hypothetical protein
MTDNPFTPEIVGWAQAGQRVFQIPASLNLAAGFVESSLGKATPPGSNNWHGIKATAGSVAQTREQRADGSWYTITSAFAIFGTPAASFMAYAKLLGTGEPYLAAVKTYLASERGVADVRMLATSIAIRYATAIAYGRALISVMDEHNLYVYDKLPAIMPAPKPAAPAQPKATTMFSFASLFSLIPTAVADIEAVLANPIVQQLEQLIAANFSHVTTPGSAAILEPLVTATSPKLGAR